MAPLPPNVTVRWFVDYSYPGGQHTMQFRTPEPASEGDAIAEIRGFLLLLAPILPANWTTIGLRKANTGSNLSFPRAMAAVVGGHIDALPVQYYPRFISYVGRGPTGRRVRITLFGAHAVTTDNYRLTAGENAQLHSALDYLQDSARTFVTVGGDKPFWNDYVNAGYNAYFQRKARKTG